MMQFKQFSVLAGLLIGGVFASQPALAQSSEELAKQLSNPVANLISVPLQYNYNDGFLNGRADQGYINIQPVIPFSISADWNVISRTILPLVHQDGFLPDGSSQLGLGNTLQSFFFSPKAPTASGLIWGVGPVFQLPTATDDIANNQWGAGLTGVVLKQSGPWTMGGLANHVWSVGKSDEYGKTSATFLQPFLSYTTASATSFTVNTETTYDWEGDQWSVPVNFVVSQMFNVGGQPMQIGGGVRYWFDSPEGGPKGWGARAMLVFLFPKG